MGVKRQQDWLSTCTVVLVGDARVGKTALVNRVVADKFTESYVKTSSSGEKTEWNFTVAGRKVRYSIIDTNGSRSSSSVSKSSSSLSLHNTTSSSASSGGSWKSSASYREADVFLLCYRISDPSSLFSAINYWCPEIRCHAPTTPIILVGCQSDMRNDRDVLATLARRGQAPVSADQGLTLSQQAGCVLYVETSAKISARSTLSAFEVASLAKYGQLTTPRQHNYHLTQQKQQPMSQMSMSLMSLAMPSQPQFSHQQQKMPPPVPPKPTLQSATPPIVAPKPKPRRAISTMALNTDEKTAVYDKENYYTPSNAGNGQYRGYNMSAVSQHNLNMDPVKSMSKGQVSQHRLVSASRSHLSSCTSPRLSFKTSRDRSMSSLLSIGQRTPKMARRCNNSNLEKTVTIKCQRLNADKQFEEVDVEVPAPIYETLRFYNSCSDASNTDTTSSRGSASANGILGGGHKGGRSFTAKIKSFFGR